MEYLYETRQVEEELKVIVTLVVSFGNSFIIACSKCTCLQTQ